MRALPVMLVVAALGIPLIPATSGADDLSDLAAREKERRKGKEGKVYTEDDLKKKDDPVRPQQPPDGNDGSGITLVFNFPLEGDTVYGRVPLNAQFFETFNVDATFYVNDVLLGKGVDVRNWINATWDTSALPAGKYSIRVDAVDSKGKKGSAKINVTLAKTVNIDPAVASCKKSTAKPAADVFGLQNPFGGDQEGISVMKDLGAKWIRQTFTWKTIELVPGNYDWWYPDLVVTWAHDAGLQMLAIPNHAPAWVDKLDWPQRYDAYQAFTQAMVERYKPGGTFAQKEGWKDGYGVSYWEMLNEPNLNDFGWQWAPNPARYTLWLAHGEAGVRAADPNAFVVFGGLSNVGFAPAGFLEYSYVLGAKDCFDVISHHPYGYMDRFTDLVAKVNGLSATYGDPNKPIWFTEYGTIYRNQADEITKVFQQKGAAQGWFWFGVRDSPSEAWGVVKNDWEKKQPAYDTLKTLLAGK